MRRRVEALEGVMGAAVSVGPCKLLGISVTNTHMRMPLKLRQLRLANLNCDCYNVLATWQPILRKTIFLCAQFYSPWQLHAGMLGNNDQLS